jgi:stringent starvation protein B
MSAPRSRRPYLIRAIYDWALDCGYTPYLLVAADQPGVSVPTAYVKDGRIAFDISPMAVRNLNLEHDPIFFSARFGGSPFEILVPSGAVLSIYARESGEGVQFGAPEPLPPGTTPDGGAPQPASPNSDGPKGPSGRPKLRVVK